jgi:hypothetical protein
VFLHLCEIYIYVHPCKNHFLEILNSSIDVKLDTRLCVCVCVRVCVCFLFSNNYLFEKDDICTCA